MYLANTTAGGETIFTDSQAPLEQICSNTIQVACRVPPIAGTAVWWANLRPDGEPDLAARHGSCPVGAGAEKWIMQFWIGAPVNHTDDTENLVALRGFWSPIDAL